jgi:transcriptional regulator
MSGYSRQEGVVADRADLLQGTLDLLILKSLQLEPLHGWGISRRIRQLSREALQVNQGSLYPALYRLEDQKLIASAWGISPEGRRAKFYRLTARGQKRLAAERDGWLRFVGAVTRVLEAD